ncbi:GxxExxY protein [Skermanella stibiiresistens SB22]|uniref:GxxExxY protein n=1 Tax=Skermanella stibiiresistens SB22 TaxID=1385369 RepID=W9H483_9PROT|nr:GxxExxY protein [Skermanella stibiiresistens SB22]
MTEKIIGCAFAVSNTLGHGFLENVYKNALALEIEAAGLFVRKEQPFPAHYRDNQVGLYIADLVVDNTVIVELKATAVLTPVHLSQVLNYLKACRLPVGLILNFGQPRLEVKRVMR